MIMFCYDLQSYLCWELCFLLFFLIAITNLEKDLMIQIKNVYCFHFCRAHSIDAIFILNIWCTVVYENMSKPKNIIWHPLKFVIFENWELNKSAFCNSEAMLVESICCRPHPSLYESAWHLVCSRTQIWIHILLKTKIWKLLVNNLPDID
jgi:hypothetical protein